MVLNDLNSGERERELDLIIGIIMGKGQTSIIFWVFWTEAKTKKVFKTTLTGNQNLEPLDPQTKPHF